jgi:serine/threonine protein kinase
MKFLSSKIEMDSCKKNTRHRQSKKARNCMVHTADTHRTEIGIGREARVFRCGNRAVRIPHNAKKHYNPAIIRMKPHPNVVQILAVEDESGIIEMRYIHGTSLAMMLDTGPPRALNAVQLMLHILNGVAHLHNNNIVHGDLSCHNIIVYRGGLQIIDFYAERPLHGSPIYMAPEVVQFDRASVQGDIWSTGVLMLMLEGLDPWSDFELPRLIFHLGSNPTALYGPPEVGASVLFADTVRLIFQAYGDRASLTAVRRSIKDLVPSYLIS